MAHTHTPPSRGGIRWQSLLPIAGLLSSIWLSFAQAAKPASDYYVHRLPGAPAEPRLDMYAGHIEITPEHHGNLFFWLAKNRHIANKQRLVLWLNGGPGCSSMDGALMEIGPYRVNEDGTLRLQDGSWDEFANVLFIDQPVGTGFSYVDTNAYVHEMDEMAQQMITFLNAFFDIFPEHEHHDVSAFPPVSLSHVANPCRSTSQANPTLANGFHTLQKPSSIATPNRELTLSGTCWACSSEMVGSPVLTSTSPISPMRTRPAS